MKQQIRAELKQGIVRRWYLYILPFALGAVSTAAFLNRYALLEAWTGELRVASFGDCFAYIFRGMQEYIPNQHQPFEVPVLFLLINILLAVLIAGERRWRAARLAGLKEVPVVIKDYDDQQIVEIALIENIQREDLNPIEEAHAYERLIQEFNLTQDEVAERVSKSRTTVTNALRLLKLTEKVQQMLIDDMLSTGHVRALITIADPQLQYETAMYIFDKKLSVRETVIC